MKCSLQKEGSGSDHNLQAQCLGLLEFVWLGLGSCAVLPVNMGTVSREVELGP